MSAFMAKRKAPLAFSFSGFDHEADAQVCAFKVRFRADCVAKVESCKATNFWRKLEARTDRRFV